MKWRRIRAAASRRVRRGTIAGHRLLLETMTATMPHGGMIRVSEEQWQAGDQTVADAFVSSMERGLALLHVGSIDGCRAVSKAVVETMDFFDVDTNEHVWVWRVACEQVQPR